MAKETPKKVVVAAGGKSQVMTTAGPAPSPVNAGAAAVSAATNVPTEPASSDVGQAEAPPAPPVVSRVSAAPAPKLKVKDSRNDVVYITVFRDIEPPPIVGNWNGATELGVRKLEPQKTYAVPKHVAEVIVDAKAGALLQVVAGPAPAAPAE